jgi:hypothetical protein
MILFWIWLSGAIASVAGLLIFQGYADAAGYKQHQFDGAELSMSILMALLWPVTLIAIAVIGAGVGLQSIGEVIYHAQQRKQIHQAEHKRILRTSVEQLADEDLDRNPPTY